MENIYTIWSTAAALLLAGSIAAQSPSQGTPLRGGAAPANDECTAAEPIAVVAVTNCASAQVTGNNITSVLTSDNPSCDVSSVGYEDVWYTFNSGGYATVRIELGNVNATDLNFAVQTSCDTSTEIACEIFPFVPIEVPVTPNTDYYVRVFSNLQYGVGGEFTLCISYAGTVAPPANDECAAAIPLMATATCQPLAGTSSGATQSMAAALCSGSTSAGANDVWYSFTATTVNDSVLVEGLDDYDAVVEAFSGTCGNLTSLACRDDNFPQGTSATERLFIPGLTVGAVYYIRVYDHGHLSAAHNFNICIKSDPSSAVGEWTAPRFTLYPNPARGNITISGADLHGIVDFEFADLAGRVIYAQKQTVIANQPLTLQLDGKLARGTYTLRVNTANGSSSRPVMVQ